MSMVAAGSMISADRGMMAMFTDEERAWFLARERKAYQARLKACGSTREPKDQRLAWAYALLEEDEPTAPNVGMPGRQDVSMPASAGSGIAPRLAHVLESPARVTMAVMAVGALLMLGIAIVDALHLPGVRYPLFRSVNDLASWFPGDVIVVGVLLYGLARAARWAAMRCLRAA
jgi:hypothetical protein